MRNVADTLRTPSRRWAWISGGVAAVAVVVAAVIAGPSIAANLNPKSVPTPTLTPYVSTLSPDELASVQHGAELQAAVIASEAAARASAEKAAEIQNDYARRGLTSEGKCPPGTVAGEVHDDGSEGLCAPTGPGGAPCVEYTDNVCTGWLKP